MTDGRQREEKGWEEGEAFYRRRSLCRQRATPFSFANREARKKGRKVDDSSSVGRRPLHRGRRTQHCNFCHRHHRQNQEAKMGCSIEFVLQNHTKERTQLVFVPASVQIGVWRKSPSRLLSRKLSPLACETAAAASSAFFPEIISASSSLSRRRRRRRRRASEQEAVMVVLLLPSPPLFKAPVSFPPCLKWRRGERGSRSIFRQKLHFAFPLVFFVQSWRVCRRRSSRGGTIWLHGYSIHASDFFRTSH